MITKAEEAGFRAAFTVIPRKVTKDTDRWRIHRYMVFGKDPKTFTRAVNSILPARRRRPPPAPAGREQGLGSYPAPAQPVFPAANTVVRNQNPDISISLAREPQLNPKDMGMRVSGFGLVNARDMTPGKSHRNGHPPVPCASARSPSRYGGRFPAATSGKRPPGNSGLRSRKCISFPETSSNDRLRSRRVRRKEQRYPAGERLKAASFAD